MCANPTTALSDTYKDPLVQNHIVFLAVYIIKLMALVLTFKLFVHSFFLLDETNYE